VASSPAEKACVETKAMLTGENAKKEVEKTRESIRSISAIFAFFAVK